MNRKPIMNLRTENEVANVLPDTTDNKPFTPEDPSDEELDAFLKWFDDAKQNQKPIVVACSTFVDGYRAGKKSIIGNPATPEDVEKE